MGVRRATPTSLRHPDVLSTPTLRVPHSLMNAIIHEAHGRVPTFPGVGEFETFPRVSPVEFGGAQTLWTGTAFVVESLLARKMGQADALVMGRLRGHAGLAGIAVDVVPDPATEKSELTHMLTIEVDVQAGADRLDRPTPSYSRLEWVEIEKLAEAVSRKDPFHLVSDLDLSVCLYGLCVSSAVEVARSEERS